MQQYDDNFHSPRSIYHLTNMKTWCEQIKNNITHSPFSTALRMRNRAVARGHTMHRQRRSMVAANRYRMPTPYVRVSLPDTTERIFITADSLQVSHSLFIHKKTRYTQLKVVKDFLDFSKRAWYQSRHSTVARLQYSVSVQLLSQFQTRVTIAWLDSCGLAPINLGHIITSQYLKVFFTDFFLNYDDMAFKKSVNITAILLRSWRGSSNVQMLTYGKPIVPTVCHDWTKNLKFEFAFMILVPLLSLRCMHASLLE